LLLDDDDVFCGGFCLNCCVPIDLSDDDRFGFHCTGRSSITPVADAADAEDVSVRVGTCVFACSP
jgi:hypothetical protein